MRKLNHKWRWFIAVLIVLLILPAGVLLADTTDRAVETGSVDCPHDDLTEGENDDDEGDDNDDDHEGDDDNDCDDDEGDDGENGDDEGDDNDDDPVLPAPTDLEVIGDLTSAPLALTFTWRYRVNDIDRPLWFQVAVANQNFRLVKDRWLPAERICGEERCAVGFDDLFDYDLDNGEYHWWVRAAASRELTSRWSEASVFVVDVPESDEPIGFTVTTEHGYVVVGAENKRGISWYQVVVLDEENHFVHSQWYKKNRRNCSPTRCWFILHFHPENGIYNAYLLGWGPGGFARGGQLQGWAGPIEFEINFEPPDDTDPITPTHHGGGPRFWWHSPHGATWFEVWIGTPGPEWKPVHHGWHWVTEIECNEGVCILDFGEDLDLASGETYIWFIRSWGPGGFGHGTFEGGWSQGQQFEWHD